MFDIAEPPVYWSVALVYLPKRLREAVDIVQSHEPNTKPASRSRKADMIDYIVEHVAGPGY